MADDDLDLVLGDFPPVSYAFAYGSGVFRQRNYSDKQASSAMTDVVLAVEDPEAWHAENLARNREHYSGLAWFGPSAIAAVQRRGAGLYFNPYARVSSGRLLKYGVVSRSVLEDDLSHWSSLYVAGRMHKPVRVLRDHAESDWPVNVPWAEDPRPGGMRVGTVTAVVMDMAERKMYATPGSPRDYDFVELSL